MNDVFLNIAGGIKVVDPAIDLAIVAALVSSLHDIPIDKKVTFAGEVGLSGEVRAVNRIAQRIQEADRMGYTTMYISKYNGDLNPGDYGLKVVVIGKIDELLESLFA